MDLDAFLRAEVKPALGCTEPGAVALAAAHAAAALGRPVEAVDLGLSVNIYKNGRSVMLPRTGGLKGNRLAAALGALAGNPDYGLTVLRDIEPADVERARALTASGAVRERVVERTDEGEVPSVCDRGPGGRRRARRPVCASPGGTTGWNIWSATAERCTGPRPRRPPRGRISRPN